MISAAKFSRDYTSFWNNLFPMTEALVRSINLNYERFAREPKDLFHSDPQRRGLLNEVGFQLSKLAWPQTDLTKDVLREAAYLAAAGSLKSVDKNANISPLTDDEWQESVFLCERLTMFCRGWYADGVVFSPVVRGCGFIDSGVADALIGAVLLEVKAGDRNFRAIDLRQVITYAALLNLENPERVMSICLVNPRRGVFYKADKDSICLTAGGITSSAAFSHITAFASGAFNSI